MKLNIVLKELSLFFKRTFACFSLMTLVMAIVGLFENTDEIYKFLAVNQILTFFVFSLFFALSFCIADFIKKNVVLKRAVQFVLTYASLVGVFFFGGSFTNYVEKNGIQNTGFSILTISFFFVVIYFVCALVSLIIRTLYKKTENKDDEYENVYKK